MLAGWRRQKRRKGRGPASAPCLVSLLLEGARIGRLQEELVKIGRTCAPAIRPDLQPVGRVFAAVGRDQRFDISLPTQTLQILSEYKAAKIRQSQLETSLEGVVDIRAPRAGPVLRADAAWLEEKAKARKR